MQIWCVGAGAMGMLIAGKLAAAGQPVLLVTRTAEQAEAIRREGLTITAGGRRERATVHVCPFGELKSGRGETLPAPEWLLLLVKQRHLTGEMLQALPRWADSGTRIVCFQNGVGHAELLAGTMLAHRIDLAVTTEGAKKSSATEVAHTGSGTTWIGPAFPSPVGEPIEPARNPQKKLADLLNQAGFDVSLSNNMKEIVWNKLLVNAVINPLTALLRVRNGVLPANGYSLQLMRALYDEAAAVARRLGIGLRPDLWEHILQVCRNTAENASSMLQDVSAGRETEIEWINGAIVRHAERAGVPVPVNETVYRMVRALESGTGAI